MRKQLHCPHPLRGIRKSKVAYQDAQRLSTKNTWGFYAQVFCIPIGSLAVDEAVEQLDDEVVMVPFQPPPCPWPCYMISCHGAI